MSLVIESREKPFQTSLPRLLNISIHQHEIQQMLPESYSKSKPIM